MEEYASRSGFPHSKRWHGHASYTHILIVPTDKAKCYPPALRNVLLTVEHRRSKYLNNGLERDHQHFKQRVYPMRGFKQAVSVDIMARGYVLIQNLRNGFSHLSAHVPRLLRLAAAWPQLAQAI